MLILHLHGKIEDFVTDKTIYIYIYISSYHHNIGALCWCCFYRCFSDQIIRHFACACTQTCTLYIHTYTCSICTTHTYLYIYYALILHHMHPYAPEIPTFTAATQWGFVWCSYLTIVVRGNWCVEPICSPMLNALKMPKDTYEKILAFILGGIFACQILVWDHSFCWTMLTVVPSIHLGFSHLNHASLRDVSWFTFTWSQFMYTGRWADGVWKKLSLT